MFKPPLIALVVAASLAACNSDSSTPLPDKPGQLKVGILPDTQGGGDNIAIHPMEAVLAKHQAEGVNLVIPVGDLTDNGSTQEWAQWRSIAEKYQAQGMEFLPVMGNHETSHAYTVEWIENMRHYIPEDAIHMPTAEWLNYYIIRENTLVIGLAYYNLPIAFGWIKDVIADNEGKFDHIVIASHDGLVGAKYGQTREQIVQGTKGDNRLFDIHKEIRGLFAEHDVIWVQGHEHMYQRSQIHARVLGSNDPGGMSDVYSSTPSGGNYRMPSYTQIIGGNASYKGYEYRFGERELIQDIIQHKMATMNNGSEFFDANAGILTFNDQQVDYQAYFAPHTIKNNEEGAKELENPEWKLMDSFSRTTNRCESLIYPNSIPEGQRPILNHIVEYKTNHCVAGDSSKVRLIGGTNNTFNRVDTTERTMGYTAGLSRAESMNDMLRLSQQFMFTQNKAWDPNLNAKNRVIAGERGEDEHGSEKGNLVVPATTIDMKKHVTLSWLPADEHTQSDIAIISGMDVHTGTYQSAYGAIKNLRQDSGLDDSQPDGTKKLPHTALPSAASQEWDMTNSKGDSFGLEFTSSENLDNGNSLLAHKVNGQWQALTSAECVIDTPWDEDFLANPPARKPVCTDQLLVGYDNQFGHRWWVILHSDSTVALIKQ